MTTTLTDAVAPRAATMRTRRVFVPLALLAIRDGGRRLLAGRISGRCWRGTKRQDCSRPCARAWCSSGWLALLAIAGRAGCDGTYAPCTCDWVRGCSRSVSLLIVVGVATALGKIRRTRSPPANFALGASAGCSAPLRDMIVFAPFLAAGWIYRRRPEIHKRIMLVATTILLVAAVSRMRFWGLPPPEALIL